MITEDLHYLQSEVKSLKPHGQNVTYKHLYFATISKIIKYII